MKTEKFKPGDYVWVVDGDFHGQVVRVQGKKIIVNDENGFTYEFFEFELVHAEPLVFSPKEIPLSGEDESYSRKKKNRPGKTYPEVDLHREKISSIPAHAPPGLILRFQLEHLENFVRKMQKSGIKKFVVIHGKGSGKLASEVKKLLKRKGYNVYPYSFYNEGAVVAELR
jgi:DNA-nicking Smr family endonuclease